MASTFRAKCLRHLMVCQVYRLRQSRLASQSAKTASNDGRLDIDQLLAEPTWNVSDLLPPVSEEHESAVVSSQQLHHILRLSALSSPQNKAEEKKMLSILSSQLHFVREIQKVDTTNVEPLRSIRDETLQGEKEAEFGLEAMKEALCEEEIRGKYHKRIRRRQETLEESREAVQWDVLGSAAKKVGRYFVVEGGKDR